MNKIFVFILFLIAGLISEAGADVIHLKNGRSIEGLIKEENEESIELDVGIGTVKFNREAIETIDRSSADEKAVIRQEWQREKKLEEERDLKRKQGLEEDRRGEESKPKEIRFSQSSGNMVVNALLNKKVSASFLLDTGSSIVLLSSRIAEKLEIQTHGAMDPTIELEVADGRKVKATYIVLDSVDLEGAEARNVGAGVLPDDSQMEDQDGLLGMSFLNKFNFRIDTINKKLILEKPKPQNILEKTEYFSVTCPSDWERSADKEKLFIFGPFLPEEENKFQRPYIAIEKDVDGSTVDSTEGYRGQYNKWKDLPDVRRKMSELLEESFKNSNSEYEFISSNFDEKKDTIILSIIYFFKKYNEKIYSVKIIKKDGPIKSYNLCFFCVGKRFNEYLPVFNKCLESFTINE